MFNQRQAHHFRHAAAAAVQFPDVRRATALNIHEDELLWSLIGGDAARDPTTNHCLKYSSGNVSVVDEVPVAVFILSNDVLTNSSSDNSNSRNHGRRPTKTT